LCIYIYIYIYIYNFIYTYISIKCDGTTKYSYVEVTVKGARHNNEDASYADGKLFGVYDGHGGKHASILLRTKVYVVCVCVCVCVFYAAIYNDMYMCIIYTRYIYKSWLKIFMWRYIIIGDV
jgi:hypothetical protein